MLSEYVRDTLPGPASLTEAACQLVELFDIRRSGHVRHGRDRLLQPLPFGQRPDESEEVRQLTRQLRLAALAERAEVFGREDVADEGQRQRKDEREPEHGSEGEADAKNRD